MYLSYEARSIRDTGSCPRDPGGRTELYPAGEPVETGYAATVVRCPTCGAEWRKFTFLAILSMAPQPWLYGRADPAPATTITGPSPPAPTQPRPESSSRGPTDRSISVPRPIRWAGAKTVNIAGGTRRRESIGTDVIDFDNSRSSSTSVETLKIAHTTQFAMTFNVDSATVGEGTVSTGLFDFAKIEGRLQATVRRQHGLQGTTTLSVERTSQQTIPARTHVRITLDWVRVWQDGEITLQTSDGSLVLLPYSVTLQLDFSKRVEDVL